MLFYNVSPGATRTTNAAANTTNDALFIAPGSLSRLRDERNLPRGARREPDEHFRHLVPPAENGRRLRAPAERPSRRRRKRRGTPLPARPPAIPLAPLPRGPERCRRCRHEHRQRHDEPRQLAGARVRRGAFAFTLAKTKDLDIFNVASAVSLSYEMSIDTLAG